MNLRVLLPTHVAVDEPVRKVIAEGAEGAFALLPRHADVVAALGRGLLIYESEAGERFLALNGGTLIKCGDEVLVSTPGAVQGDDLGALREAARNAFEATSEQERRARSALQRMEVDFVRRFVEFEQPRA